MKNAPRIHEKAARLGEEERRASERATRFERISRVARLRVNGSPPRGFPLHLRSHTGSELRVRSDRDTNLCGNTTTEKDTPAKESRLRNSLRETEQPLLISSTAGIMAAPQLVLILSLLERVFVPRTVALT